MSAQEGERLQGAAQAILPPPADTHINTTTKSQIKDFSQASHVANLPNPIFNLFSSQRNLHSLYWARHFVLGLVTNSNQLAANLLSKEHPNQCDISYLFINIFSFRVFWVHVPLIFAHGPLYCISNRCHTNYPPMGSRTLRALNPNVSQLAIGKSQ